MKPYKPKKINKSIKYYMLCGGVAVLIILGLLLLYAYLTHTDIIAWLSSKYAFITYGAILIYLTIGIILIVRDKIRNM
jgi:hypothetical protein